MYALLVIVGIVIVVFVVVAFVRWLANPDLETFEEVIEDEFDDVVTFGDSVVTGVVTQVEQVFAPPPPIVEEDVTPVVPFPTVVPPVDLMPSAPDVPASDPVSDRIEQTETIESVSDTGSSSSTDC